MSNLPVPSVVLRRSPRSIAKLFDGTRIEGLTTEQTSVLLSLAHCTGWSADRIRLLIKDMTDIDIKAEDVWSFHWRWVMDRGKQQTIRAEEIEVMKCVLSSLGITIASEGRPLHATQQPISVDFMKKWSPKTYDGRPLCKGFTMAAREQAKAWLYYQKLSEFGSLSPSEEVITHQFGATIETLIKKTLKNWAKALRAKIRVDGPYKSLKEREHVQLIMDHLMKYHDCYEALYGLMEDSRLGQLGHIKDNTVYIRSTGYGVKVLIGLMMADRLHVIDRRRREEKQRVGYDQVPASDLPADSMNCPICQDPLGTETPEGTSEQALRLIICCGQVIGKSCLKAWLAQAGQGIRKSCPTCRFEFTPSFLEKLFDGKEPWFDGESLDEDDDMEDAIVVDSSIVYLISPSPEPQTALVPEPAEAASPADIERFVLMNPAHTEIPRGVRGLPDVGAAVSVGDAEAQRTDDFMSEG